MKTKELLPQSITAIEAKTYSVESVVEIIAEDNEITPDEVTLAMVMERVRGWAEEDFGYKAEIIYQDENGVEVNE